MAAPEMPVFFDAVKFPAAECLVWAEKEHFETLLCFLP
jgi:hypothetical protein